MAANPHVRIATATALARKVLGAAVEGAAGPDARQQLKLASDLLLILPAAINTLNRIATNKSTDARLAATKRMASIGRAVRP